MIPEIKVPVVEMKNLKARGTFYAGGKLSEGENWLHVHGQMYVEVYVPERISHPYPLIMLHGAGMTGLNWLAKADGSQGWCPHFVEQGFVVYVVDQPARGRSSYHPEEDGEQRIHDLHDLHKRFTSNQGDWYTAHLHDQMFDEVNELGSGMHMQFASACMPYLKSTAETQAKNADAFGDLLEKTGPAILMTHSQAGGIGWLVADRYPDKIVSVIALEPAGPPFSAGTTSQGVAEWPLHLVPELADQSTLPKKRFYSGRPEEEEGWLLDTDAYSLPTLAGKPIAIVTTEASYHSKYDYLTSLFFEKLGVPNDYIRLADLGIHGNGHMMMMEKNALDIARVVLEWMEKNSL